MGLGPYIYLAVILFFLMAAMKKPFYGVVGYVLLYATWNTRTYHGQLVSTYLSRPSLVVSLCLILGALIHYKDLYWRISRKEVELLLLLLIAWGVSLGPGVGMHSLAWYYLDKITKCMVFLFLLIRIVHSMEDYRRLETLFIISALYLSYLSHSYFNFGRLNSIGGVDFNEANGFAAFMAFAATIVGYRIISSPFWKRIAYIFAAALFLNSVIMTQSRAVLIGLVAAFPVVLITAPRKQQLKITLYASLGVILFFLLAHKQFWERMSTIEDNARMTQQTNMGSAEAPLSRLDFWRASVKIFRDHPFGIGVKNFYRVVTWYDPRNPGKDAHNTYVLCYTELGIQGILIFLLLIAETIWQLGRTNKLARGRPMEPEVRNSVNTLRAVYVIYFVGYMTTHSNLYSEFLWILLALPICLENAVKNEVAALEAEPATDVEALPATDPAVLPETGFGQDETEGADPERNHSWT